MNLYLICEQVDSSALWINDITDGILRESIKKALNLVAITDGQIHQNLLVTAYEKERPLMLVVGYSLPWITRTVNELCRIDCEPILVSVSPIRLNDSCCSVCFDTEDAMRQMIHMIAAAGRRKIALFGIHRDTVGDVSKLFGYTKGMRECNLAFSATDIYSRGLLADISELLNGHIRDYDAIVCANDLLAIWLTRHLEQQGLRIPEDIFITGFGNWKSVDYFSPRITRMYTDLAELGCEAVRLHQYMQYNSHAKCCHSVLPCTFQPGDTAPISGLLQQNMHAEIPPQSPQWYTDPDILEVLTVERFIRETDEIDHVILSMLNCCHTYSTIAETVNVSESTVKYRINRMLRIFDFTGRNQLMDFAAKYHISQQTNRKETLG